MKAKRYITPSEAAKIIGISRQRVDVLISDGRLTVVERVGPQKIRLLDRKAVKQFKKAREKKAKK